MPPILQRCQDSGLPSNFSCCDPSWRCFDADFTWKKGAFTGEHGDFSGAVKV